MTNGSPFPPVPDLGQLRMPGSSQDIPAMVQKAILDGAGVQAGGTSVVETVSNTMTLDDTNILVMFGPPGIQILGVVGRMAGSPVMVPWHAVVGIEAP